MSGRMWYERRQNMRSAIVCDGHFRVYEDGTVMRIVGGKEVLAPQNNVNGYRKVTYSCNGRQHHVYVHRLVADGFIPMDESRPHINHINGDRADNRVENLERVTPSENTRHAYAAGLFKNYHCVVCGEPTHSDRHICHLCAKDVKRQRNAEKSERLWKRRRESMASKYMDVDESLLSERQAEIVWYAKSGMIAREIADITGTTRQYISQVLKDVDAKVQKQTEKEKLYRMTLEELKSSTKETISPSEAAPLLGCNAYSIILMARYHPDLLGFKVSAIGNRTRIDRVSLVQFLEDTPAEDRHL